MGSKLVDPLKNGLVDKAIGSQQQDAAGGEPLATGGV